MTTKRITVSLADDELQRLLKAAERDLRHPREQARYILRQGLGMEAKSAVTVGTQSGAAVTVPER